MNMDQNSLCHISLNKKELFGPCDWEGNLDLLNIVMIGVTDEIPERGKKLGLHRLISALMSSELPKQEKLDIIPSLTLDEYNSARILDCFQGSGTFGFSKNVVWKPSSRKNLS